VVSLVAELRGHERHAAEELEQWKTHLEERSQRCIAGGDYAGCSPRRSQGGFRRPGGILSPKKWTIQVANSVTKTSVLVTVPKGIDGLHQTVLVRRR
jgi:hypothetical protein